MTVQDALREIEDYKHKIERFDKLFCERLAEEAQDIAQQYYRSAEYAGDNDVIVNVVANGDGSYKVVANGSAVLFIEFGTGITKADATAERDLVVHGDVLNHGEYGKKQGANPKGWNYEGTSGAIPPSGTYTLKNGIVHTKGNNATPAMYNARKHIMNIYREVAKEVWGDA